MLNKLFCILVLSCCILFIGTEMSEDYDVNSKIDNITVESSMYSFINEMQIKSEREKSKIDSILFSYNKELSDSVKQLIVDEIYKSTIKYDNLDVDFVCALITHESAKTWNPEVRSHVGAVGLMQIMPYTGVSLINRMSDKIQYTDIVEILTNPVYNIRLGTMLLSNLLESYGIEGALIGYNGGERHTNRWLRNNRDFSILPEETQKYVPYVLKYYNNFKTIGT